MNSRRHNKRISGIGCVYRQYPSERNLWRRRDVTANADVSAISIVPKDVEFQMVIGAVIEHTVTGPQTVVVPPSSIYFCCESFVAPSAKAVEVFSKDQSFGVNVHEQSQNGGNHWAVGADLPLCNVWPPSLQCNSLVRR